MLQTRDLAERERLQRQGELLADQLQQLEPLLRKMHLLSANAVSAAARAGSEGDAFRVLTQAIQALRQDIQHQLRQAQAFSTQLPTLSEAKALVECIRGLDRCLSELPIAVRKGEYLAIYSAVEAAHAENFGDSFEAVASMLKQLIAELRIQVAAQQEILQELVDRDR